ncbi:MAG: 50S ribosomal protein L25, partial [Bacteroidales bacterium]|nr:50S ribosomal protein L25 [Bacteroidales bacterium]
MKQVSMSGSLRENVGKKDARKHRVQGLVPCVMYGGKEQLHFTLDEKAFGKLIFTPDAYLVNITLGSNTYRAILKDVQYHPVSDSVLHADFLEVMDGKPIITSLPIIFSGTSKGVLRGGRLVKKLRKLKVKGLLEDTPDAIEIDITKLNIAQSILIRDMKHPKLRFLDPENSVIVSVKTARAVIVADEDEGTEEEGSTE